MTTTPLSLDLRATTTITEAGDWRDSLEGASFVWHGSETVVAFGAAATVPAESVDDALESISCDPGSPSPIAVGVLPFTGPARFTIPQRVLRFGSDGTAVTSIEPASELRHAPRHEREPARFTVSSLTRREEWAQSVHHALAQIAHGSLEKVVLARAVDVEADADFDLDTIVRRLAIAQGGTYVYRHGSFVGASPELLVRRRSNTVESRPMAGTIARGADAEADDWNAIALANSVKDAGEHQLVLDAVTSALQRFCDPLVRPEHPVVERFPTISHLVSHVRGELREPTSALTLARALHPTPAVNGTPSDRALELIRELEPTPRGDYAGAVGWVDAHGDGEFAVALRSAQVDGPRARLFAGAGIVAGSDPEAEWYETQAKFEPMLRALIRP